MEDEELLRRLKRMENEGDLENVEKDLNLKSEKNPSRSTLKFYQ